jgi:iron complex outermembrane receptor protein
MRKLALLGVVVAKVAYAEPLAAVDVADLPPLPAPTEEESSSASVLAAASTEEDVVVGAAKREQSLGNVASAVTVVSGDRLRRFGYRTVGEAVGAVAGVYLVDNRLSYSIGIRGLQIPGDYNTRILVLVDGASVNEGWGSFAGLGLDNFVAIDDVARIEVIRGPVSSVYGANAFFGIVNIVTRGAAETPKAWARTSINSINGSITSAGFAQGGVRQQVRGSVQIMDRFGETTHVDEVTPSQDLKADGSRSYAASLVASYGGSFAQVRAYKYRRDTPFAPYGGDFTASVPYYSTDTQLLVEGGHTHEIGRLTLSARGYAKLYDYTDHIIYAGDSPFDDLGQGRQYGAELRGRYELLPDGKLGITGGTEATYYHTYSKSYTEGDEVCADGHAACVPKDFNIEGVYTEVDGQPTKWLGFTGGLRFDNNSVIDQRLSPRAALFIAKPEHYGVKFLYAEGFRNPSAYEAFFYDNVSFSQPQGLKAETIRSLETVLWAKPAPGLSTRLSAFYWSARNVVEQLPDPADPAFLQFQNAGRYVSQGLEAEGSYRTARGWYGFAGATYADVGCAECGAFTEGMDPKAVEFGHVPNAPALSGAAGISTPQLFGHLHVSTELVYIGDRPTRPDVDTGAASPDSPAWVGWNWTLYVPNIRGFDVTAGVRNVLGKRDLVPAPGVYDRFDSTAMTTRTVPRVPGEGREVYVKVGYSY